MILDLGGNALDGEPVQLPSGDGTAGGDYTATFTVAAALPTLASIQTNVFTPRCAGCHTGVGATLARRPELDEREHELRGARRRREPSKVPALQRVTAGNPNDSYLDPQARGHARTSSTIACHSSARSSTQTTIDSIRLWITNGAAQ